ncbi:zona pellucida sperm-binding protein 3 receptor [Ochotona princeps]|uniref:zona pellucida sperm-binding protein 3 receptor n=1 Tax=Ochotona princeps TaxID=9978 RepID=UPI0027155889|nr:zona pellucida sperm-binding protein 3 receptor [Ochotona princeps]XP_058525108.1 zona pellucida sperm-binding protein 3 receptor [Ochotona princeps]XP_058525109.1 zona pellucida sperm-binding protein 3 receptor [Ochotona princeps]
MPSPRAPSEGLGRSTLLRKGGKTEWPFSKLCKVLDPTLFQVTLIAVLLAPVLGDCEPPPVLPFASPTNLLYDTTFKTGTTLKYNCLPGYKKINSTWIICTANGDWSYNIFCTRKQCKHPGELPNGKVEVKDLYLGSEIEFRCFRGYTLTGSITSRCEVSGKGVGWSNHRPECVIIKCELPPAISNGRHNGNELVYTFGSSVTYSCDPHYSLIGQASISCTVENSNTTGFWSPNPPTCKKIACDQPQIINAVFEFEPASLNNFKDTIVIKCKKGYIIRGSSKMHCEENNEWYPSAPTCELNSCLDLPEVPFASWEKAGLNPRAEEAFEVGTELKYKCNPGYRPAPTDSLTVKCQENFSWSTSKGCERVCCPTPDMENIIVISDRRDITGICVYAYGDYVSFTCDKGYYPLSTDGRSSCQADGTWKPKMPTCEPVMCMKPDIINGVLSVDKEQYAEFENITIQCDFGYAVVGPPNIICLENRTWYPQLPKCVWAMAEECEHVVIGRKLLQCLATPEDVTMALNVYKLFLEIKRLEQQTMQRPRFSKRKKIKGQILPIN